MLIIGVTGGVGTGKSTVASMFQRLGARVFDADRITHELMEPHTSVWAAIRGRFGEVVLTASGKIDRKRLGRIVFQDPKGLRDLTRIVHPAVRRRIRDRLSRLRREAPNSIAVLDVPLLVEAGNAYVVDALVVVSASRRKVAQRLQARSGWSLAEIRKRQACQLPLRVKERRADFVVRNDGSKQQTHRQVVKVFNAFQKSVFGQA